MTLIQFWMGTEPEITSAAGLRCTCLFTAYFQCSQGCLGVELPAGRMCWWVGKRREVGSEVTQVANSIGPVLARALKQP